MALSAEQLKKRDGKITASFAPYLMNGDNQKILNEWKRLIGDPQYEPEDLSANWAVQFGSFIETFALDWHEKKTGQILSERGQVVNHPETPHVCCTLDAYRVYDNTAIDCKAVNSHRKLDDVLSLYAPQMVVQKGCTKASNAALLIVHGGAEPAEYAVPLTAEYEASVWERINWFWGCVQNLTPPVQIDAAAPVPVEERIEINMDGNNEWATLAADWLANKDAAIKFGDAANGIKELVKPEASKAFGYGIVASRNKANAISIKGGQS